MIGRAIEKLTAPARRRIAMMVNRCTVKLVNDALKMQRVQITLMADEALDGVEHLQSYGFTSNPLPDAEAIALSVGGLRNHVVVIACDDRRYRLTGLQSGEVAMYTDEGDKIVLKRGNIIEITSATKVRLVTPRVEMTGNLDVTGNTVLHGTLNVTGLITGTGGLAISGGAGASLAGGTLTHDGVNIGKTHVHGGVQPGAGDTGAPH
ncbi:MAG: Phage-related baseplate assembly protein [bacterium]|nr:Phage-related baseplate assembly protein [bacterium]